MIFGKSLCYQAIPFIMDHKFGLYSISESSSVLVMSCYWEPGDEAGYDPSPLTSLRLRQAHTRVDCADRCVPGSPFRYMRAWVWG